MEDEQFIVAPLSPRELRALGHPLRLRILQLLVDGPSTASSLARLLGESSGATSYHLRALHRVGMVEEAEQPNARERWWKRVTVRAMIPNSIAPETPPGERAELEAAHARIESFLLAADERGLQRWQDARYSHPIDLQDATWIGNSRLWVTAMELAELRNLILEATLPLRRPREGDDVFEVHMTLRLLPQDTTAE